MINERDFIRFVGKLVFNPDQCGWGQMPPEQMECFCVQAEKAGLEILFLLTLGDALPKKFHDAFSQVHHREAMTRLIEKAQLMAFNRLLDEQHIPHLAFKGADLAFRIYPAPALRPHVDWDVLFPRDDCQTVIRTLAAQGWQTYSGRPLEEIQGWTHHYERMHNDKSSIEIHWTLPHFGSAAPEEIWKETERDATGQIHLTPEMNLLMLCAHASGEDYSHVSDWRLLLDAGYILKHDTIDWKKVRALADRWGIIRPDLLLSFWKDFFPEETIPLNDIDLMKQAALREVFQLRGQIHRAKKYDKSIVPGKKGVWPWLKDRLGFYFRPGSICGKYKLQRHQIFRIFACAVWDFAGKSWYFCTHYFSRQCQDIRRFRKALDYVENGSKMRNPPPLDVATNGQTGQQGDE